MIKKDEMQAKGHMTHKKDIIKLIFFILSTQLFHGRYVSSSFCVLKEQEPLLHSKGSNIYYSFETVNIKAGLSFFILIISAIESDMTSCEYT